MADSFALSVGPLVTWAVQQFEELPAFMLAMTITLFMDPPLFGNTRIEKYTPDRNGTFDFLFTATIFNARCEFRKKNSARKQNE